MHWVVRTRDVQGRVVDTHLVEAESPAEAYEHVAVLLVAPDHVEVEEISPEDYAALARKIRRGAS
jgi:hypothetical protein